MAAGAAPDEMTTRLDPVSFSEIPGWQSDDHQAAFACFLNSARRMRQRPYSTKKLGIDSLALAKAGEIALELAGQSGTGEARRFFENCFKPCRIVPSANQGDYPGLVTGYYEPEAEASPVCTDRFCYPIMRRPDDLVELDRANRPANIDDSVFFAKNVNGVIQPYEDRSAIESGALDGKGLEMFWLESRIDVFFIHIQGSARLVMPTGEVRRISYDGKTGHPFTAIGRVLVDMGEISPDRVSMQSIRSWLKVNPQRADEIMRLNRSYIFFQEIDHPDPQMGPVAAAGVPLSAGRSLAIDHRLQTFGTPIWVSTEKPLAGTGSTFARLMIAQDTGSAIVGPARGDLFMGSGHRAGEKAGAISNSADFIALVPVI